MLVLLGQKEQQIDRFGSPRSAECQVMLHALIVIHFWFDPVAFHYGAYKGDNFDTWTVPVSLSVRVVPSVCCLGRKLMTLCHKLLQFTK
jgi:hypothetical protein